MRFKDQYESKMPSRGLLTLKASSITPFNFHVVEQGPAYWQAGENEISVYLDRERLSNSWYG
jgi:hypothetical protein